MYKAIYYTDGRFEVQEVSEEEAYGRTETTYSFVNREGSGVYAIRSTKEKAVNTLLDDMKEAIKKKESEIASIKAKIKVIEDTLPKPKRCWMCKHWGTVTYLGQPVRHYTDFNAFVELSPEDAHKNAVAQFKGCTAPCPFHHTKTGKRCRCMPSYHEVCEHFEEFK